MAKFGAETEEQFAFATAPHRTDTEHTHTHTHIYVWGGVWGCVGCVGVSVKQATSLSEYYKQGELTTRDKCVIYCNAPNEINTSELRFPIFQKKKKLLKEGKTGQSHGEGSLVTLVPVGSLNAYAVSHACGRQGANLRTPLSQESAGPLALPNQKKKKNGKPS